MELLILQHSASTIRETGPLSQCAAATESSDSNISQFRLSPFFLPLLFHANVSQFTESLVRDLISVLFVVIFFCGGPGNRKCTGAVVRKRLVLWPQGLNVRLLHVPQLTGDEGYGMEQLSGASGICHNC